MLTFERATRAGSHVVISLAGPSGSGKTYSAILMAQGLAGPSGRIGFVDTENGRGRLYSDLADYQIAQLEPPFHPDRYIQAIDDAEQAGFDVLIIDSATHEWEGPGGCVEMAESAVDKQGHARADFGKWAKPKALHKRFVQRMLQAKMHIILCLRAKQPIREERTPNGRKEVILDDWQAIQEKHFIYEMTVSCTLRPDATLTVTKAPRDLLPAFGIKDVPQSTSQRINASTGAAIRDWVAGGAPIDDALWDLHAQATRAAEVGTEAFRAFWSTLDHDQRERLRPSLDDFKSRAQASDGAGESGETVAPGAAE